MIKEQIEYALHHAEDPAEWVFELVRGLEKRIDELVKYGTKVTVFQKHWHPASELPKESGIYVVITDFYSCQTATFAKYDKDNGWDTTDKDNGWDTTDIDNIEWWCYLPEEE